MITFDPKEVLIVQVSATQLPAACRRTAAMCVVCLPKMSLAVRRMAMRCDVEFSAIGGDFRGKGLDINRIDESARNGDEIGIAEEIGAVGESEFHRVGDDSDAVGRIVLLERFEIEMLKHAEDLRDMDAAGTWRGKADDGVIAITRDERFAQLHFIRGEIVAGEDAAVVVHPFADRLGQWPGVEPGDAVVSDGAISAGEVGLLEDLSLRIRRAVGLQQNPSRFRKERNLLRGGGELFCVTRLERKAALGKIGRGAQQIGKRAPARAMENEIINRKRTRNTAGERTGLREVEKRREVSPCPLRINISRVAAAGAVSRPSSASIVPSARRTSMKHPPPMPEL